MKIRPIVILVESVQIFREFHLEFSRVVKFP